MRIALSLREFGRTYRSTVNNGTANQYSVLDMPPGEQALIANFGSRYRDAWRWLRVYREGIDTGWQGKGAYQSPAAALAMLQKQVDGGFSL